MPKQVDYPRATLKNSLQLVQAVDDLGGKCSGEMAADKLNKKMSGAFAALTGSAVKYGLLTSKKGQLEVTQLYRDFKLAYSKDEANKALVKAFLTPPLFMGIYDRFVGMALPVEHFEKLLIREFDVPEQFGSRVSKYFLEGAKQCRLLNSENMISNNDIDEDEGNFEGSGDESNASLSASGEYTRMRPKAIDNESYSVRITGPGMDSVMAIEEPEDLLIVRAMLKKIEKSLAANSNEDLEDS